jgi:starch-binding outer membrane protein SusE/F
MKRKSIYRILAVLFTATIFFAACTKEDPDVKLAPKLSTAQLLDVKSDGATVVGFVIAQGDGFTERGVCYNTATAPTVANSKAVYTGTTTKATFNVIMSGLAYATKYYVRAYGTDANGATVYGEEFSFTTLPVVPTLNTAEVTDITGSTASSGGMVLVDGGAEVTVHGICYSEAQNPTIANSKTADGKAAGPYVSALTNLKGSTVYYVRAYATNSAGTGYGPEMSFRTAVAVPTVTTKAVTGITASGANSGGEVTFDGGAAVTSRGVCWSVNANPTIADSKTSNGIGWGVFTSTLSGLNISTTYHVRAYAVNSAGAGYGPEVTFMTFPVAIYALGDGTAAGWDNTKAIKIDQSATVGIYSDTLDLSAAKNLKFILTLGQWAPQYGTDASGTSVSGNLVFRPTESVPDPSPIPTPAKADQYRVTVNLTNLTYKIEPLIPENLYMIGDGVGDWVWANTNLPMVKVNGYPNLFWKIVWMNTAGSFKFAPQRDWINDFGSTVAAPVVGPAGTVYAKGGENIPVPGTPGYYMVVVDYTGGKIAVADPKVYLIGNTINSWDGQNAAGLFTVDNANSLVTITKTLVAADLRMYAYHPWILDWWRAEFNIFSGKIEFRGTGGDQAAVPVTAGEHKIDLNFKTGAGTIN